MKCDGGYYIFPWQCMQYPKTVCSLFPKRITIIKMTPLRGEVASSKWPMALYKVSVGSTKDVVK